MILFKKGFARYANVTKPSNIQITVRVDGHHAEANMETPQVFFICGQHIFSAGMGIKPLAYFRLRCVLRNR